MFSFVVSFPDLKLKAEHLPYSMDVWVNGELQISEVNIMDLEPLRLVLLTNRIKSRVVANIRTQCGNYHRDFLFDRSFSALRRTYNG